MKNGGFVSPSGCGGKAKVVLFPDGYGKSLESMYVGQFDFLIGFRAYLFRMLDDTIMRNDNIYYLVVVVNTNE